MIAPPTALRSMALRCALVLLLVVVPLGCKSSRDSAPTTSVLNLTTTSSSMPATSTTSTTTPTTLPPTTTTAPLVTIGGIVKVANASGIDGAAGRLTDELTALGFDTRNATNAAAIDRDLDTSKIYVVEGSEAVAESVSRVMGGLPISRMPTPAWIAGGTAGLGDSTVLVMLGHDRAGVALADMVG